MPPPTLTALEPQQSGVVISLDFDFAVRERLAALGVRVGRRLRLVRRIGRAGPLQVRIDHTDLILRAVDAERIRVQIEPDTGP